MIRDLHKDTRAQAFSLDVMLSLIIITVIMGMSASALDSVSFKINDYSAGRSLDRITADAAEILVKTPGSPPDWQKSSGSLAGVTPGLAEVDSGGKTVSHTLDIKKILKLQSAYPELINGKVLPPGANSSLVIYPADPRLKSIALNNQTPPSKTAQVAVANRTVQCDFIYLESLVCVNTSEGFPFNPKNWSVREICPHESLVGSLKHQGPDFILDKPGWTCNNFKVDQWELNSTDFYLLTDPSIIADNSARWFVDRPENMTSEIQTFNSAPILINNRISQVLGQDQVALFWLHVYSSGDPSKSFRVYVVSVPKGTPPEEVKIEYLNPQPCFLVLTVWW